GGVVDTLHWAGRNSRIGAAACGLPVGTLPGAYKRGRQRGGMLRLLGGPGLIASDRAEYVALASRLVGDRVWRDELCARIRASQDRLFDVSDAIDALQDLFQGGVPTR